MVGRENTRAHSWRPWGNACEPGEGEDEESDRGRVEIEEPQAGDVKQGWEGEVSHTPWQHFLTAQLLARKAEPAGAAGQARSFLSPPTPGSGHDPERPRPASEVELCAQE